MQHLGAPRPGGALAALEGAPDADVVFFAHHGFPEGDGRGVERAAAADHGRDRALAVRAEEIPEGQDARIDWLFGWWGRSTRGSEKNLHASDEFPKGLASIRVRCSPHATIAQETAEIAMAIPRPPLT